MPIRATLLSGLVLLGLGLGLGPASALAAPPSPSNPAGRILGVLPPHGQASKTSGAGGNLSYHNGPVMHTNRTYAIYWVPAGYSVSSRYQSLIDGFLGNVAAASGTNGNVYASDTQYFDNQNGNIFYQSAFGAAGTLDTNPFPTSGCRDSYTSICLSDAQIQTEINRVVTAAGWTRGPSTMFFLMTPKNVGSCAGSSCAYSQYCAYHSWFGSGPSVTLYANQPYAAYVPAACGSGQSPNGDDADSTINVLSHEHNETITDEQGSAWYDRRGAENGDKCAWNFGVPIGSTSTGRYNQVIGTGTYYLQQEWSNHSSGCVLTGT